MSQVINSPIEPATTDRPLPASVAPIETSKAPSLTVELLKRGAQSSAITILVLAVMVGVWAAIVAIFKFSPVELPSPASVWHAGSTYGSILLNNTWPTLLEGGVGFLLAICTGIPIGYLLAKPGKLATALNTGVLTAQIFPKIAIAPLFIVWFGFGYLPKFLFVLVLGFFPIVINSAAGFMSMPIELGELGQIVGMTRLQRLRRLQGPWALPQIFTGLKISASFAIIAALVYEFVGAQKGLGVLIVQSEANLNMPLMFAALIIVAFLGFLFYGVIAILEAVAVPWHVSRRRPR